MTVREIIKRFTFIEIFQGMALTLRKMFSHAVTIQYPKERRPIAPGFRGQHALAKDPIGKDKVCGLRPLRCHLPFAVHIACRTIKDKLTIMK